MTRVLQLTICFAVVVILSQELFAFSKVNSIAGAYPLTHPHEDQTDVDLYKRFTDNIKSNPPVAYEAGKAYLEKHGARGGPEDQYVKYIKRWVHAYERIEILKQIQAKNYDAAFARGKQVLAEDPEDLVILFELSRAGFDAATGGNSVNNSDTIAFASKTIELLQAGRTFKPGEPVARKDQIIGNLNFVVGNLIRETQPSEAVIYLIRAAQLDGAARSEPLTYVFLAEAYEKSDYSKVLSQFDAKCRTETLKTIECIELQTKAEQVIDRMMDALARAIAYSESGPKAEPYAAARAQWLEQLTSLYKFRNNGSATGIKELIASITSKPIPTPDQPQR